MEGVATLEKKSEKFRCPAGGPPSEHDLLVASRIRMRIVSRLRSSVALVDVPYMDVAAFAFVAAAAVFAVVPARLVLHPLAGHALLDPALGLRLVQPRLRQPLEVPDDGAEVFVHVTYFFSVSRCVCVDHVALDPWAEAFQPRPVPLIHFRYKAVRKVLRSVTDQFVF